MPFGKVNPNSKGPAPTINVGLAKLSKARQYAWTLDQMERLARAERRNFFICGHGSWFPKDQRFTIPGSMQLHFYVPHEGLLANHDGNRLEMYSGMRGAVPWIEKLTDVNKRLPDHMHPSARNRAVKRVGTVDPARLPKPCETIAGGALCYDYRLFPADGSVGNLAVLELHMLPHNTFMRMCPSGKADGLLLSEILQDPAMRGADIHWLACRQVIADHKSTSGLFSELPFDMDRPAWAK